MNDDFDDDFQRAIDRPYAKYALWAGLGAFGAVALALYLQHFHAMEPCSWCTFQRLLYLVIGVLAVFAWALAGTPAIARTLAGLAALTGFGGLTSAVYQHLVAAPSGSCAMTFADKALSTLQLSQSMPWLFEARAMCDEANLPMLGIPFSLWSAMAFLVLTLVLLIVTFCKGPLR